MLRDSLLALLVVGCAADDEGGAQREVDAAAAGAGGSAGMAGDVFQEPGESAAAGSGDRGGSRAHACVDPEPLSLDGEATGLARCADGTAERVAAGQCRLADLSMNPPCPVAGAGGGAGWPGTPGAYCEDACLAGLYGRPKVWPHFHPIPGEQYKYSCEYFCRTDADCPTQMGCACDAQGNGTCVPAECTTTDDCASGESCRQLRVEEPCGLERFAFACLGDEDVCAADSDCGPTTYCEPMPNGAFAGGTQCARRGCTVGRPLVVGGAAMVAGLRATQAWTRVSPDLSSWRLRLRGQDEPEHTTKRFERTTAGRSIIRRATVAPAGHRRRAPRDQGGCVEPLGSSPCPHSQT